MSVMEWCPLEQPLHVCLTSDLSVPVPLSFSCIMASNHKIFTSDPEFCPDCGTILPVPGVEDLVVCKKCAYSVPVEGIDGSLSSLSLSLTVLLLFFCFGSEIRQD